MKDYIEPLQFRDANKGYLHVYANNNKEHWVAITSEMAGIMPGEDSTIIVH